MSKAILVLCIGKSAGGTGHQTKLSPVCHPYRNSSKKMECVPEETVDNTDQTPPVATAKVNMMMAADAEEFDQLDESYFLGL